MPITFTQAQTALADKAPSGKIADFINRALERLIDIGGVKGLTETQTFTVYSTEQSGIPACVLELPLKYSAILGAIIRGTQTGIAAEWYPFLPGVPVDSLGLPKHPITDQGIVQASGKRRYYVPMTGEDTEVTVRARLRLQHVELTDGATILPISNLSALGLAVEAVGYENSGDFESSGKYFARAVDILRESKKESEPDIMGNSPVRVIFLGAGAPAQSFY